MTTIDPIFYSSTASRSAGVNRPASTTGFADQMAQAATETNEAQSDEPADSLAELKELKRQQVNMSPRDYLSARLALQETISAERLEAGEDFDVFGVRFEGRVFSLAGNLHGPGSLESAKLSDGEADNLPSYRLARPIGAGSGE